MLFLLFAYAAYYVHMLEVILLLAVQLAASLLLKQPSLICFICVVLVIK